MVPPVSAKHWKKAQVLVQKGWPNLGYKCGNCFVFPSEKILQDLPEDATTIDQQRAYIKTWVHEFTALTKNFSGYYKLTNGDWDYDVLCDMLFSFWVVMEIDETHPRKADLRAVGVVHTCSCPQFLHYHVCKHQLAWALHTKECKIPAKYDMRTCGKRKATAGASLSKRGRCLQIDD